MVEPFVLHEQNRIRRNLCCQLLDVGERTVEPPPVGDGSGELGFVRGLDVVFEGIQDIGHTVCNLLGTLLEQQWIRDRVIDEDL